MSKSIHKFKVGDKVGWNTHGEVGKIYTVVKIINFSGSVHIRSENRNTYLALENELYFVPMGKVQQVDSPTKENTGEYSYYEYSFNGVKLDPYRILSVYNITCPAMQHAIKKLLRAGNSVKDLKQDIQEVIDTLKRKLDMLEEDEQVFIEDSEV